jgi:hypothetical protein
MPREEFAEGQTLRTPIPYGNYEIGAGRARRKPEDSPIRI